MINLFKSKRQRNLKAIKNVVKHFNCGVCVTREDLTIIYFNNHFPELIGFAGEMLFSRPFSSILPLREIKRLQYSHSLKKIKHYSRKPLFALCYQTSFDSDNYQIFLVIESFTCFGFITKQGKITRERLLHYDQLLSINFSNSSPWRLQKERKKTFKRFIVSVIFFLLFDIILSSIPGVLTGDFLNKYFIFPRREHRQEEVLSD